MSLQQELDQFMDGVKKQAPASVLDVVDRANTALAKSEQLRNSLTVGDKVPQFSLPNQSGTSIELKSLLARGPVVISFYRGAWCPFCNLEINALHKALPQINNLGANLVAISPEKPDFTLEMINKHSLTFDVLQDAGNVVAKQFGITFKLEGDLRKVSLEAFGVDLPKFNGDESWEIPVPATYVVDTDRSIQFAFVDPEFRHRAEPAEIISVLSRLRK